MRTYNINIINSIFSFVLFFSVSYNIPTNIIDIYYNIRIIKLCFSSIIPRARACEQSPADENRILLISLGHANPLCLPSWCAHPLLPPQFSIQYIGTGKRKIAVGRPGVGYVFFGHCSHLLYYYYTWFVVTQILYHPDVKSFNVPYPNIRVTCPIVFLFILLHTDNLRTNVFVINYLSVIMHLYYV